MKLYVQKPGGWTAANPQGVFEETARKVKADYSVKEYKVYYRVVPDPVVNIDTKHRQPALALATRTGERIRRENWQAPGVLAYGHGSTITLKENFFCCRDCARKLPMHLQSDTLAPKDYLYRLTDGKGKVRRDAVFHSEEKIPEWRAYRSGFSFANVCTKCANKRIAGAAAAAADVPVAPEKPVAKPFVPPVYAPKPKKVVEQYGMIVDGKIMLGRGYIIREADIIAYNAAIATKQRSAASMKPRIHRKVA